MAVAPGGRSFGRGKLIYVGPTVKCRYDIDSLRRGVREIAMGSHLNLAVRQVVTLRAIPYARTIAPVWTGTYKRSFKLNMTTYVSKEHPMIRSCAEMYNDAKHDRRWKDHAGSYAMVIAFGWAGVKNEATFRRTLRFLDRPTS